MATIEQQIQIEKDMVAFGISRYKTGVNKANDKSRGSDNSSSQKLLHEFITPVADAIIEYIAFLEKKPIGINAKFRDLFKFVAPETAAYLGLRTIFDHFTQSRPLVSLGLHIGMLIEDEAKFKKFHSANPDYYEAIIKDFNKKGTKNYRHMHRVLTFKATEQNVKWTSWSKEDKVRLGITIVDLVLQNTNLIERREENKATKKMHKKKTIIVPTQECIDWVHKFNAHCEIMNPNHTPCVIQPDPWIDTTQGGYYTPQLRLRSPLVKVRNKEQSKLFKKNMAPVLEVINTLQEVPWKINSKVLNVLTEAWEKSLAIGLPQSEPYALSPSPAPKGMKKDNMTPQLLDMFKEWKAETRVIHTMNKERISKCFQVVRVLKMAKECVKYDKFYYVYYCDFRGRIYSRVHGLSPQGTDYAKAMLTFSKGVPLTETGLYWLRVHGANCFGFDKVSYEDRIKWIISNEGMILDVAENPISNKSLWSNADKPWQFLAFCFEYQEYKRHGLGVLTHLPIGLDGSCNGLQNFSAMLRDETGGKATNLVPGRIPSDIYSEVAKVCTEKLKSETGELSRAWLQFCKKEHNGIIPRGLTKRPVMTLPYGSTRQSCREYIFKYIIEEAPNAFDPKIRFKLSVYLTPILWASISEVVIAARVGMDWIQKCATIISKANKPLYWVTPLGFPVYRETYREKTVQIRTELAGSIQLRMNVETTKINVMKQKQGASPNFIHSLDANHLMLTILKAKELGLNQFACIHDDYGTNAEDTPLLHKAIREAFVELYSKHNPLQMFKEINEKQIKTELPALPAMGKLDINQVLESEYFFG